MKFSKLDLLTLLISLFVFASCNKSNTLGLDLDPNDAVQGALVDTLTITTKTVADEPTPTFYDVTSAVNPSRPPMGYLVDPLFGTSEASLAFSVNLPSAAYSFGTNALVDSAVLVLPYATEFYGDTTTSVYSVDVHQLQKNISLETSFLSNRDWAYNAAPVGNFTGKIKPKTPFKITDIVSGKADTLKAAPASIRIKLDKSFVQQNIVNLGSFALQNNASFNEIMKGLHVSINKANTTGTGGLMFFNLNGSTSRLELYYKKQNATTATATDTVSVNFPITQSGGPVAATIKHNYTGTPVATQLADVSKKQYDVTYLQGLAGLRNKITFPYLKAFAKNIGGKIIINKAELVVDLSTGTDVAPFLPAPRLAMYRIDLAGQRTLIPDQSSTDKRYTGNFGTGYNSTSKKYSFIVTGYIQDLLDGKIEDYGTYLAPGPTLLSEYGVTPTIISGSRSVIGSFTNGTNKVKLNIYYTKVN